MQLGKLNILNSYSSFVCLHFANEKEQLTIVQLIIDSLPLLISVQKPPK